MEQQRQRDTLVSFAKKVAAVFEKANVLTLAPLREEDDEGEARMR